MIQSQLINSVIVWERQLEIEEEKRKNHRFEPCVNYLAAPQPCCKERKPIFARIFQRRKDKESQASAGYATALKF